MKACMDGLNRLHRVIEVAPADISRRLWTLYWLVRMQARLIDAPPVCVELGTRRGDSARALLCACEDTGGTLHSFDVEDVGQHVRDVTAGYGVRWFDASWHFRQQDSRQAGRQWKGKADLVFVDTDHTYQTTREEIEAWAPHVRNGGVMAFHDYWLTHPGADGVKPAVDQWADSHPHDWKIETHDAYADSDTGLALLWRLS